ncbi:MAG: hypothetical protein ACQETH_12160 [Candidatus Rifleibacteriota bacterium]
MIENKIKVKILCYVLIVFFLLPAHQTEGCDLADHDWVPIFDVELDLSGPLIPLAEIDIASKIFVPDQITNIVWFCRSSTTQLAGFFLKNFTGNWITSKPWLCREKGEELPDKLKISEKTLFITSEKESLRIAFFLDANSDFKCKEIIFFQSGLKRFLVKNLEGKRFIKEFKGSYWLCIKFWQNLSLQNILSITFYPWKDHETIIYENQNLAEKLLSTGGLKYSGNPGVDTSLSDLPGFN